MTCPNLEMYIWVNYGNFEGIVLEIVSDDDWLLVYPTKTVITVLRESINFLFSINNLVLSHQDRATNRIKQTQTRPKSSLEHRKIQISQ
jgi:hypothetical protein